MSKKLRIDESTTVKQGSATITVQAEPIEIEVDPLELGKKPAEALARAIARGIQSAPQASPGTLRQRRAKGISGTQKWNATGHLAASIRAERDGNGYAVVAPADRLQDDELLEKLIADVPQVDEPGPELDAAIEQVADEMFTTRRR